MEIEKVARIVALFIAFMALGLWIATMVFFPEARYATRIPLLIVLAGGLRLIWHKRCPETTKTNNQP